MEKPRLQRMYYDFLQKAGYELETEKNGDIAFLYKDFWFAIEIYDEEINFNRLCLMVESEFDENTIFHAYIAASETSGSFKLTKVYIRDGNLANDKQFIVFAIPFMLEHFGDFKKNFERMADEMLDAYYEFNEVMDKLKSADK
jgi:hypothetical protein